jgi:hypothetical protein
MTGANANKEPIRNGASAGTDADTKGSADLRTFERRDSVSPLLFLPHG